MKLKKLLGVGLLLVLASFLVACGGGGDGIEGRWNYGGTEFYVFNANGTGTMAGIPIAWSTSNGILSVCSTPDFCGSIANCSEPERWTYSISGRNLTLTSTESPSVTFTYRRR
ncbi:MAG: hypothetical protein FWB74_01275 [Defluviitaleaceae bacterium]|nr:hypothetical protein [Defluviitaleaceae bacterium]